jgi:hypothetical protein
MGPEANKKVEFELAKEYYYAGQHRFELRIKGTPISINVAADNIDEAIEKAFKILHNSGALKNLSKD